MFYLAPYLDRKRRTVNASLDAIIPPAAARPAVLHKAIRYSVFSGGKRLRPILCMAAAEAAGGTARDALFPALAIELLHTYTLIHDDLPCMDDDDLRRGKPTCHIVFGEANALLAADALQAMAFGALARTKASSRYPLDRFVIELATAAGSRGVVGGQVEDLATGHQKPTRATLAYIHRHKTADLFRAALRMGAMSARAGERDLRALTEYGESLGLAFQITDDILDSSPGGSKRRKLDKASCLLVYGPQNARRKATALIQKAISSLAGMERRPTEPLRALAELIGERRD